ncbi:MAG: SDR family oxidoreductase [Hyphomonadaceae bacterium]|nr:SDR family oxidoreductase [Hyphomonadaceae bacterium]
MSDDLDLNRRGLLTGATLVAGAAATAPAMAQVAEPDLKGKTVLITGASSGFGRLGAEYYARRGAKVFASMRNTPRPEADALRTLAQRERLQIEVVEIDVLSDASVTQGVARVLAAAGGKVDALVNNAGIGISGPVEVQDMAATQLAFDTNVFGCHRMVRAVLPSMRAARQGHIFQISSQLGRLIVPGAGHYSATKFALEAMSEQLAYELVPLGVDVTIIQPGGYPTNVWINRNRYTADLKARTDAALQAGYPHLTQTMTAEDGSGRTADPMDVPRAIAEIMAMPAGRRPLRRAVHPRMRPQEGVNAAMAEAQKAFLGATPYGAWVRDALD